WELHPSLLDGCLQSVLAAGAGGQDTYMPIGVDSIRVFRAASRDLRCRLALRPSAAGNTETLSADLDIVTPEAEVVATIRGVHLKRANLPGRSGAAATRFGVEWVRADLQDGAERLA